MKTHLLLTVFKDGNILSRMPHEFTLEESYIKYRGVVVHELQQVNLESQ